VGCDRVQGFLTGEPISPEKVAELLGQPKRHALLAKNLIEEAGRRLRSKLMP
jgi:hypothetical protein